MSASKPEAIVPLLSSPNSFAGFVEVKATIFSYVRLRLKYPSVNKIFNVDWAPEIPPQPSK